MNWWEVSVAVDDEDAAALLSSLLARMGAEGFWEEEGQLIAYFHASDRNEQQLRAEIQPVAAYARDVGIQFFEDRNWDAPDSSLAFEVRQLIRFHPQALPGHQEPLELELDVEGAFGDGRHPTTRNLLQRMLEHPWPYCRVLDIGCGTGVLSLAAARLGAQPVVAIDNDWRSVARTQENAQRNHCPHIQVAQAAAPQLPEGVFDCILANIMLRILLDTLPEMARRLPHGGIALMSGYMPAEHQRLCDAATPLGLQCVWEHSEAGWMTSEFYKATP